MMEWHVEHMEKTVVKYVTGLSPNASAWERRNHKRYGRLTNICRQIEYDIKHGVTNEEVLYTVQEVRNHSSFSSLRKIDGSTGRIDEIEKHFVPPHEKRLSMA